jgi:hypothetical protein
MATIVTREVGATAKNSPLTNAEVDANFINLNTELATKASNSTGYPTLRPSLLLDFANSQIFDPRVTFTRASTATRTNSKGQIELVASGVPRIDYDQVTGECKGLLVEESRTNLLTYSEQFDNAAWVKTQGTVSANVIAAPDGTFTADKFIEDTSALEHFPYQNCTVTSGTSYTVSFFIKSGGRTKARIQMSALGFGTYTQINADFDLSTGVVIRQGSSVTGATIQAFASGWYRCTMTLPATATTTSAVCLLPLEGTSSAYTGDGTSGLYIWGAQLEVGSSPTTYIPSTVTHTGRASTATFIGSNGLIQTAASGVARYSYNPLNLSAAPALLLEEARTNLLTYSGAVAGTNWSLDTCTATLNNASAPDGTTTATLLNDASASEAGYVNQVITVAVADTTTYTFSCYVKQGTAAKTGISFFALGGSPQNASGIFTEIEWATGVVTTNANGTATNVGNGWWRLTTVYTNTANTSLFCRVYPAGRHPESTTTGTCYAWGAQLEAGTFPSSYIPTTTAQVTRAADSSTSAATTRAADIAPMTGANFSSWYRQDEGTFVVDYRCDHIGGQWFPSAWYVDSGNSNRFGHSISNTTKNVNYDSLTAGVTTAYLVYANSADDVKSAFAYRQNDMAASTLGNAVISDTSTTVPPVNALTIGGRMSGAQLNGHVRRIAYYPKRLTNAELHDFSAFSLHFIKLF